MSKFFLLKMIDAAPEDPVKAGTIWQMTQNKPEEKRGLVMK